MISPLSSSLSQGSLISGRWDRFGSHAVLTTLDTPQMPTCPLSTSWNDLFFSPTIPFLLLSLKMLSTHPRNTISLFSTSNSLSQIQIQHVPICSALFFSFLQFSASYYQLELVFCLSYVCNPGLGSNLSARARVRTHVHAPTHIFNQKRRLYSYRPPDVESWHWALSTGRMGRCCFVSWHHGGENCEPHRKMDPTSMKPKMAIFLNKDQF